MAPLVNQDLKLYERAVELFETRKSNGGAYKKGLLQRFLFGRGSLPPIPNLHGVS